MNKMARYLAHLSMTEKGMCALRDAQERHGQYIITNEFAVPRMFWTRPPDRITGAAYLTDEGVEAHHAVHAYWDEIQEESRDHLREALDAMMPYVDEIWDGKGYKPSMKMMTLYFVGVTAPDPSRVLKFQLVTPPPTSQSGIADVGGLLIVAPFLTHTIVFPIITKC